MRWGILARGTSFAARLGCGELGSDSERCKLRRLVGVEHMGARAKACHPFLFPSSHRALAKAGQPAEKNAAHRPHGEGAQRPIGEGDELARPRRIASGRTGALSNASKAGRSRTGSWGQARSKKIGTGSVGRKVA
jgi:hypothetical protein